MKTKIILFLSAILFTASFSQGTYPLHIGNVWQYRDSFDTMHVAWTERAVRDTVLPNGYHYTTVKVNDNTLGPLIRQDGSKVFFYTHSPTVDSLDRHIERLRYDFSKTIDDTVSMNIVSSPSGTDTIIVRVTDDRMFNIFGKLRRTWVFSETSKRTSVYIRRQVADSVGLIYQESEAGISYTIFGAIINGTKFGTITSLKNSSPLVINTYSLYQNYPNPFNPSTTIHYSLPQPGVIRLTVYDLVGREVTTLVNEQKEAGHYTVDFNGEGLASGMYLYRLSAGPFTQFKRMMLAK